jgi:hypothetical protein
MTNTFITSVLYYNLFRRLLILRTNINCDHGSTRSASACHQGGNRFESWPDTAL